jgi:hypothetical protein
MTKELITQLLLTNAVLWVIVWFVGANTDAVFVPGAWFRLIYVSLIIGSTVAMFTLLLVRIWM